MSDNSAIEWTDATWNPVTGCAQISPGCDHCYARTFAERFRGVPGHHFEQGFDLKLHPDKLSLPVRWRRPRRIFVNSMSDLFHRDVPDGYIAQVWDVMGRCPQHTFLILTKRHARMRSWVTRWADTASDAAVPNKEPSGLPPMPYGPDEIRTVYTSNRARLFADMLDSMGRPPEGCAYPPYDWMEGQRWWPRVLPNVWLGVSVEDQQWADIRIPALLDTPAAVRWLSMEPLLGPVSLSRWLVPMDFPQHIGRDGAVYAPGTPFLNKGLSWVVVGGESGPGAREMDPDWARAIVAQCRDAQVPPFVKQLGGRWGRGVPGAGPKGANWDTWPEDLRVRQYPYETTGGRS